ncbi:EAL domain-containing protein [Pseudoduganella umbonata]|uniref:Diguanylate cyclase (GGDEF)-like protein/PAS domain S-box-containing protein n=1 Tax=Pseudoduganella umbonata TaxID=864828 RepID=A0A4P8HYE2_9BURK|nr:EAL domain-containing protein [Pseudoduganella umbonata]MBB3224124.1 diguanylate cyclase (GGDEF)-like protein/PAS domain S-box-containing protein [Pseudoduganella umbonata]QCP14012.1 EAL domain-containing protein [Pseudoduganella umbonata]
MSTILIVDDRPTNRDYLLTLLGFTQHTVYEAMDGAQALELCHLYRPDLVITDILMPTMDGYEFTQRLRAAPDLDGTPVIFFSATYSLPELRTMGAACGVRTVLHKPAEPQAILDAVNLELGLDEAYLKLPGEVARAATPPAAAYFSSPPAAPAAAPQDTVQRMAALHDLSLRLNGERDAGAMAHRFCTAAGAILHADIVVLCLLDARESSVQHVEAIGIDAALVQPVLVERGAFPGSMMDGHDVLRRCRADGDMPALPGGHPEVANLLGLAVRDQFHLYGWLYAANRRAAPCFDDADEQFIRMLSAQLAVAYENMNLYEVVQRHAAQLQMEASARRSADAALRASEARYRAMTQSAPDAIIGTDQDERVLHFNRAAEAMFGYKEQEMLGKPITLLISERSLPEHRERVQRYRKSRERSYSTRIVELTLKRKDGEEFTAELALSAVSVDGEAIFTSILRDITARRALEERLRLSAQVFDSTQDSITMTDAQGRIIGVNPAFEQTTGYTEREVMGQNPRLLRSGRHDSAFYRAMWHSLETQSQWAGEIWNRRKNGQVYPERLRINAVRDQREQVVAYVSVSSDISALKEAHTQLDFISNHDPLTLLPNRNLLNDRLQLALTAAQHGGNEVALLLFDIDRLQRVNDALGHPAGDALLQEIARRVAGIVPPGDTLAHLGADEFALVLTRYQNVDDIIVIVRKLMEQVAQPVQLAGQDLYVTASVGISVYPRDGATPGALLTGADVALSHVKEAGRNNFHFYTGEMNAHALRWMSLEVHLRHAVERNELRLYFQPQVSLADGRVTGVEALLRWQSAELGMIPPGDFIPLAEDSGLILDIGTWVIEEACRQMKAWHAKGLPPMTVAVNVSARQFATGTVPAVVRKALRDNGVAPRWLEVELTESVMMHDSDHTQMQLNELAAMGVSISLDDFGTGYSSLGYLSRFRLDKLKIDQTFVKNITTDPRSAAIARATTALAHGLNLIVVAEGVETEGQLAFLRDMGCDKIQGYLFSRPLPVDELSVLLLEQRMLAVVAVPPSVTRTLLLVDDEPGVLHALERAFRREGYQVLLASSGRQGLELLASNDVQVVLSDQRMPHMDGTEFLARARELYPHTVRMILSGYADLTSIQQAINRGAIYKFLSKPWDDGELRAAVREAFELAQPRRPALIASER